MKGIYNDPLFCGIYLDIEDIISCSGKDPGNLLKEAGRNVIIGEYGKLSHTLIEGYIYENLLFCIHIETINHMEVIHYLLRRGNKEIACLHILQLFIKPCRWIDQAEFFTDILLYLCK